MQRPDTPDGLFHAGNPATGVKGTPITADWLNALLQIPVMFSGAGEPPPENLGDNGDFYICNTTRNIYGPKTGGGWGDPWAQGIPGPAGPQGPQGPPGPPASTPWADVQTITESGALTAYDCIYRVKPSGGDVTVTLPPAYGNPGRQIYVENINDNPYSTLTIEPAEGECVDGTGSVGLAIGEGLTFYSDGLNWYRLRSVLYTLPPPQ